MGPFPSVDPIPLPAPVWLFKVLHLLTLALHFSAVYLLLGGLALATLWSLVGRIRRDATMIDAAGVVSHRLPIVTTFVINLGVPPLLFAQVLYGRALYTSTVLIGAWWISVIVLLTIGYQFLYTMAERAKNGKGFGTFGLLALAIMLTIAYIYVNNMTLMLRPSVWLEMYRGNPHGTQLAPHDPTILPRWVFMIAGAFAAGGTGVMLLGTKKYLAEPTAAFLRRWGSGVSAIGTLAWVGAGLWVLKSQPEGVAEGIAANALWKFSEYGWIGGGALLLVLAGLAAVKASTRGWLLPTLAAVAAFVATAAWTILRDGIRDVTLMKAGYDVWERTVVTNWSVVGIFLGLFVVGLGVLGWLISVVATAKKSEEHYA